MRRPADYLLIAALGAFIVVGALLRPRRALAWLMIAEGTLWEVGILSDAWLYHGGPRALQTLLDWIWIPALAGIPLISVLAVRAARGRLAFAAIGLIVAGLFAATVLDELGVSEATTSYFNVAPLAALPFALGVTLTRHRALLILGALTYVAAAAALGGWRAALVAAPVLAIPLARRRPPPGLQITTLGRFEVVRDGEPIASWPSKKARTLLKILVARRGHPATRDELMEFLWPGEDPRKLTNRLSVALTGLRQTIGAESLRTEDGTIALVGASVDVEAFLDRPEERRYGGQFLPEDRYEDWASDLRDQVGEAYAQLLRAKAAKIRNHDDAVRAYLRVLEHDPYDAPAHQQLIARLDRAGRHGEAIDRRRGYIRAMAEIGAHAAI